MGRVAIGCALALGLFPPARALGGDITPTGVVIDPSSPAVEAPQRVSRARGRATADSTLVCSTSDDCNDNLPCTEDICLDGVCRNLPIPGCVPCEVSYSQCPPVEIVFIMDTSGSMRDEAAALCSAMDNVVAEMNTRGFRVYPTFLGITQIPGGAFSCVLDTVVGNFGDVVPGPLQSCPFADGSSPHESWGPATALVAQYFPWGAEPLTSGSTRIIVPISDEGPCNGSRPEGCNDPGDDRDSITNAIAVATAPDKHVIVSPIAGTSSDACVINLGTALAAATGGRLYQTKDPKVDFKDSIISIIQQTCVADDRCDDANQCTSNDRCREGMCFGAPVAGCRTCLANFDCDDQNKCTLDSCMAGLCRWTPDYDPQTECCDPAIGARRLVDDADPCTADVCDPLTGSVSHPPAEAGIVCDDDLMCTLLDACDGSGRCAGVDLNSKPCAANADCLGLGTCNVSLSLCSCIEQAELSLHIRSPLVPGGVCYAANSNLDVDVELVRSPLAITGGQLFIHYDPAVLTLVDISPGSQTDPTSPFGSELFRTINTTNGTVFYAVGVPIGHGGARGPTIMATLHFSTPNQCASLNEICFTADNQLRTVLSDKNGQSMPFESQCTTPGRLTRGGPTLTCPAGITRNADAGRLAASILWTRPTATGSCGEALPLSCQGTDSRGFPIDSLAMSGGTFAVGVASFRCTAVDSCGLEDSCEWTVEVRPESTFIVNLGLSAPMTVGPLIRCIEFEFFSSCFFEPVVVRRPVLFGGLFNFPGHASNVTLSVPAVQSRYLCVTARDPLHTLRSSTSLSIVNNNYVASFTGDPRLGGNWLIGGNLNGDRVIDTLDYGLLLSQFNGRLDPNTTCDVEGLHADINGTGLVDLDDLAFVNRAFLNTDKAACCGSNTSAAESPGYAEITLEELSAMGYGDLSAADVNGDGVVNRDDMTLLIRRESTKMKTHHSRAKNVVTNP